MALSPRHQKYVAKVNRLMNEHCQRQHHRYDRHQGQDQHRPGVRRR